jgi:hypothetical protein
MMAGGQPALLLDLYPNAAAAYSLRKLRTAYTGSAIRVRRSSDNAEQNIGFLSNGGLDTATLTAFCSGTNGFVTTWYDQSGNLFDALQISATFQPQIVNSGNLITTNGKAALSFDGNDDDFNVPVGAYSVTDFYYVIDTNDTLYLYPLYSATTYGFVAIFGSNDPITSQNFGSPLLYSNGLLRVSSTRNNVYNAQSGYRLNVHEGADTSTWTGGYKLFNYGSGLGMSGNVQEIIIYPSNQSSNRIGIESNINLHYNIF